MYRNHRELQDQLVGKWLVRLDGKDIETIEQPVELATRELRHVRIDIARPGEAILLQLLLPHHEAVALPKKQLYVVAPAIRERKEMRAEKIKESQEAIEKYCR